MSNGPQAAWLPDGRLHLHHGPIDLIVTVEGPARETAFARAVGRFETILPELVVELDQLTAPFPGVAFNGPVARRMAEAVAPLAEDDFVTPMAAVAGAGADEILGVLATDGITKAIVNNGGDIAFFLTAGEVFHAVSPTGPVEIDGAPGPRGLATSGWRGRSQSLGIADAVTVLASCAARADVAATLIANAVDLPGHPAIKRTPASEIEAIPQLKDRLVTTGVGPLTASETGTALRAGAAYAERLLARELIAGATLLLNGETCVIGSSGSATALPADRS